MANQKERSVILMDDYLKDFGLLEKDLVGKRILDEGAGLRMFARDCVEEEVGEVWSMAKDIEDWWATKERMELAERQNPRSEWLAIWKEVEKKSQRGVFQNLPYADESFDLVLSRYALAQAIGSVEEMFLAMQESVRVLVHGGEARYFPGWADNWAEEKKAVVLAALYRMSQLPGVRVEVKRVEISIGGLKNIGSLVVLHKD